MLPVSQLLSHHIHPQVLTIQILRYTLLRPLLFSVMTYITVHPDWRHHLLIARPSSSLTLCYRAFSTQQQFPCSKPAECSHCLWDKTQVPVLCTGPCVLWPLPLQSLLPKLLSFPTMLQSCQSSFSLLTIPNSLTYLMLAHAVRFARDGNLHHNLDGIYYGSGPF